MQKRRQVDEFSYTFEIPPQTLILLGRHSHIARRALSQIEVAGAMHVTVLVSLLVSRSRSFVLYPPTPVTDTVYRPFHWRERTGPRPTLTRHHLTVTARFLAVTQSQ